MQAQIRIIKRGSQNRMSSVSANPIIKSDRERERETVNTIKAWVADWEKRKRSLHDAAMLMLRSIDRGSENKTQEFSVVS
jgi:hypothetical protein